MSGRRRVWSNRNVESVTTSITELAKSLNLSVSTVSRALNGYTDVAAATRERIEAAAAEMGYRANPTARRLVSGKTSAIGVVLPSLVEEGQFIDGMYSRLLAGVAKAVEGAGYHVFATTVAVGSPESELALFGDFINGGWADALLIVRTTVNDSRVKLAQAANLPFVTYGRTDSSEPYSWVDPDNEEAFRLAAKRQTDFGHRRIALLNGPQQYLFAKLRQRGYERGLAEAELEYDPALVCYGNLSVADGFRLCTGLLKLPDRPTSILCATDAMAIGAISACRSMGLVVGKDVSIVGYGNSEASFYCDPPLTTIEHRVFDNGLKVGEALLQLLRPGNKAQYTHLEPVELVARASDGPRI
jgi:LacI family transcriptional regulator